MNVEKREDYIYEIKPKPLMARVLGHIERFQMRVPVHIYANQNILNQIQQDRTLEQLCNVACLPGIKKHVVALSDAHQGYGFCIGCVAATDGEKGMISPGGVGYDINCGVRLIRTNLTYSELLPKLRSLLDLIFKYIPSGLGSRGKLKIEISDLKNIINEGLNWTLKNDYAIEEDLKNCEENGFLEMADENYISKKAKQRGFKQLGTLGSGNHFIEIQKVDEIYNSQIAKVFGITQKNQILIMIHTGSRALGHQVCTDSIRLFEKTMRNLKIHIPDRALTCVPSNTKEAENYLHQMAGAANFGFCNRQIITFWIRKAFENIFKKKSEEIDLNLIYGICHNILKKEEHLVDGKRMKLNVHRKGATRAFPAEHPVLPKKYKSIGQPVIIPGTMGSSSYLCIGKGNAMDLSFGSTAHGSGRIMSRAKATRNYWGNNIERELRKKGIIIKANSKKIIAEEAPQAYKDINQVVQISEDLGIIESIVKLSPVGVVKG